MNVADGVRGGLLVLVLVAGPGCGKEGAPLPPEPTGPNPPTRVTVRQLGGDAEIAATVPAARGPKPSQRPARVEVVRVVYPPGAKPPPDRDAFRLRGSIVAEADGASVVENGRLRLADTTLAALDAGGEGWTLRYGVRVLDARGRPSILVAAEDLVPVRPGVPPAGVRATAAPEGVRVDWEPVGVPCNVYRAVEDGPPSEEPLNASPVTATTWTDATVVPGTRYVYAVRSAPMAGLPRRESASSVSPPVLAEDRFAPESPTGLAVVQEGGAVRLFWNPSGARDLAGYRIVRKAGAGAWGTVGPDLVVETSFLDREIVVGEAYGYRIVAVDRSGNASEPSTEVEIDVVADPSIPSPAPDTP